MRNINIFLKLRRLNEVEIYKSSKKLLTAAVLKNTLNKNKRLLKYCLIVFFLFYCHFNISSQGMHIRFISKCKDMKIGEIKFQELGYIWVLQSDTSLIFIDNNKEFFKNGDTINFQSGSIFCSYYVYNRGIYKDFIIYQENDTITKFIELDLKDTAIFEHGDY